MRASATGRLRRGMADRPRRQADGFTLLEVLVTVFILVIGLLGLAALQLVATRANQESFQRAQALLLMQDMVDRINVNRKSARSYELGAGKYLGTGSSATCGVAADGDCQAWGQLLLGAAEKNAGGSNVGAMIGARGCIEYNAASELPGAPDTGFYTVSVVWQSQDGFTPPSTIACGAGLYPSESQRRFVFTQFRVGKLL